MAIIRWDPFRDVMTLREKMNRLFEDAVSTRGEDRDLVGSTWCPSCDIYETENEIVVTAELPGVKEEDIEVKIEDNTLSIKGERRLESEVKEENYHRIERAYGSFHRSFSLPHYVNQERINAESEDGILKVTLPKKPELKPRSVKVLKPTKKQKEEKKK